MKGQKVLESFYEYGKMEIPSPEIRVQTRSG